MADFEGFRWGVTSSSLQAEGAAPGADWSDWEATGRAPASKDGAGSAVDFADDFRLLAEMGLTDVRFTVEWARIEPAPGKINTSEIDRYTDMVRAARDAGLAPWVTLQSTTLPGWFNEDEQGWRDNKMVSRHWLPHVDRCANALGAHAEGFTPIDDPVGWALRAYHVGNRPPGLTNPLVLRDAALAALTADHRAAQLLASDGFTTMAVRSVPTIFAVEPAARPVVNWWSAFLFDSWINALGSGELTVPDRRVEMHEEWTEDFDVIGLSFDHPIAIERTGALAPHPRTARRADTGFAPLPEELGVLLERIAERLPDRDLVISANGVATGDDEWREELLRDTLSIVDDIVASGIRLRGYFHDTGIDGYEFRAGFATQRGLIDRDRKVKDSGHWFSSAIRDRPVGASSA